MCIRDRDERFCSFDYRNLFPREWEDYEICTRNTVQGILEAFWAVSYTHLYLAEKMKNNDFAAWERVFAACVNGRVAGFCTFAEKDELPEEHKFTPFIGFVFVDEPYRGKRISELMIQSAILYARELGYEKIYIMSGEIGLYEKYGFEKLGDYKTIYDSVDQLFVKAII